MNRNFSQYLYLYFNDYLVLQRNLSANTIKSYKYTFKLLLEYIITIKKIKIKDISFNIINKDLIKEFLNYLEEERNCTINSRNQRLAAIKAFYNFIGSDNIDNFANSQGILNLRFKKSYSHNMDYFNKEELKRYFSNVDTTTRKGRRNLVLLSLMYDSATRISEIINIKVQDLRLDNSPCVSVIGKGNKNRTIPIMEETKKQLLKYIDENKLTSSSYLFSNSKKEKLNERTIEYIVNKYNNTEKNITPHSLRRTRAVHLLESGVDLVYIRDFLGHSSVTTTEIYAKASADYKNKMLFKLNNEIYNDNIKSWNNDSNLLNELLNL